MQKITFDTCHIGHNKLLLTYYSYRWFSLWLKQYFNIVICIQYDFWVLLQHWACVPVFICVAMLDHQVEILNFEGTDRRCNQAQTCYWSSCFWPCFCQYLWLGSTLRRISASFEERDKKKKKGGPWCNSDWWDLKCMINPTECDRLDILIVSKRSSPTVAVAVNTFCYQYNFSIICFLDICTATLDYIATTHCPRHNSIHVEGYQASAATGPTCDKK